MVAKFDEVALLFSFWSSIVMIIGYTFIAPWWRERIGRGIVALDSAITLTLLPSALRYMFGLSPRLSFFAWYGGFSLVLVGLIALWRLWVFWRVQTEATPRREPKAPLLEEDVSQ